MKEGYLAYNPRTNRYGVLVMDLWDNDGLHCGDVFEAFIDGKWEHTSIEMSHPDEQWYLVNTDLRGEDLEHLRIRIR